MAHSITRIGGGKLGHESTKRGGGTPYTVPQYVVMISLSRGKKKERQPTGFPNRNSNSIITWSQSNRMLILANFIFSAMKGRRMAFTVRMA